MTIQGIKKFILVECIIPLRKDFTSGFIIMLTIGILVLIIQVITNTLFPVIALITKNIWAQLGISIAILIIIGIIKRRLKNNERTSWIVDILPAENLSAPEVRYPILDPTGRARYTTRIHIGNEQIDGRTYARVYLFGGGPTTLSLLEKDLIPIEEIVPTGRTCADVAKELMTLGPREISTIN